MRQIQAPPISVPQMRRVQALSVAVRQMLPIPAPSVSVRQMQRIQALPVSVRRMRTDSGAVGRTAADTRIVTNGVARGFARRLALDGVVVEVSRANESSLP
jgi:hypothetical protein